MFDLDKVVVFFRQPPVWGFAILVIMLLVGAYQSEKIENLENLEKTIEAIQQEQAKQSRVIQASLGILFREVEKKSLTPNAEESQTMNDIRKLLEDLQANP